jgi:hypothetical protein
MLEHHCGLVVDVHMVMEQVQAFIAGQDLIGRLLNMFKLKIKTLADGLAMSSFEAKAPKYFLPASVHKVVKQDASYFKTISSYDKCNVWVSSSFERRVIIFLSCTSRQH